MIVNHEYIDLKAELRQMLTAEQAWHYRIIPMSADNGDLSFYVDDTSEYKAIRDELELLFNKDIALEPISHDIIQRSLNRFYRKDTARQGGRKIDLDDDEQDFLVMLIHEAKSLGSSDIHIEPYEGRNRVRMRIDGMLVERYVVEKTDYPGLVNKIKIRANLDISEKRLPQDGRIYFEDHREKFDIRVSILPTLYGEKVVMRLLRNDASNIDIGQVGFEQADLDNYLLGVRKPNGIILISGPTGSGKTTTLYATLKLLNKETSNILTIEDPIEYTLEGINQVQVKDNIGLTFARALRTFLRQDPDIIMIGEIRDSETASIAIRAALTGHLVLSTIHTNSAWGSISRLLDMDIPPFLLASTINTTVAQRLVRLLCPHCKQQEPFDGSLYPPGFEAPEEVAVQYKAVGCEECFYTGYKGRKALFEVIPIEHKLAEKIRKNDLDITETIKEKSISLLPQNAFRCFAGGITSLEEVYPIFLNR